MCHYNGYHDTVLLCYIVLHYDVTMLHYVTLQCYYITFQCYYVTLRNITMLLCYCYMLLCVQSVRSASPICLRRSSSATPTANTRTGPVTGASTPQTGHLTFRFADNLLPWDVINTVCRSFFIPSSPHVLIFFFFKGIRGLQ